MLPYKKTTSNTTVLSAKPIFTKAKGISFFSCLVIAKDAVKTSATVDFTLTLFPMSLNTTISTIYTNLIKNREVKDAPAFLKILPAQNKRLVLNNNNNGLLLLEYQIKHNFIKIIMTYEGGVTAITLLKIGSRVKRKIFHYPD